MFSVAPNRKVLVTGGASVMGLSVARRLLALGAKMAIGDVNQHALTEATTTLASPQLLPIKLDVSNEGSVNFVVEQVARDFGRLDTLINCARYFASIQWKRCPKKSGTGFLNTNLKGTFLTCKAALPYLLGSGRGRIVNVSSDAGKRGAAMTSAYCASKFGVIGLTEAIAELGPSGVNGKAVCPITVPGIRIGRFRSQ